MTATTKTRRSGEQQHDAVEANPGIPNNGDADQQQHPRMPSAPVRTHRLVTVRRAAGVAAAAAALTVGVTAVTQDGDVIPAGRPETAAAGLPANSGHYGTADTAEHQLTATRPQQPTTHYRSADTTEHQLTATRPQQPTTHYRSADTTEHRFTASA